MPTVGTDTMLTWDGAVRHYPLVGMMRGVPFRLSCHDRLMSSVAGWLGKHGLPLTRMENALGVMRSELHPRLHLGERGTQLHVLFQSDDAEAIAEAVQGRLHGPSQVSVHQLGGESFVELNLLVSEDGRALDSMPFADLCDRLGLADVRTSTVLGEQTTANDEDFIPYGMGMSVFAGMALAACGDYGQFLYGTDAGAEILAEGRRRGVPPGDVPPFLAWFQLILDDNGSDWRTVLERTPTYLFSLVLDGRSKELSLIALRRNDRVGWAPSPYQHLFYVQGTSGVAVGRTASAVGAICQRDIAADVHLVPDMEPIIFRRPR